MCMTHSFFTLLCRRPRHGYIRQIGVHLLCLSTLFHCVYYQFAIALEYWDPLTEKNNLHNHLFYYETLRRSDLSERVRQQRDIDTGHMITRTYVSFSTLGRNFRIVLKAGCPILAPGIKAYTVDTHDEKTPLALEPNNCFTGHLQDNESIPVDAHYEDGLLCTTVHFPNETYFTEPSWRHLPESSDCDLISYRLSDVNRSFMAYLPLPLQEPLFSSSSATAGGQYPKSKKDKQKRKTSRAKIRCPIKLVADYRFYSEYCQGNLEVAVRTVLNTMQQVNRIFESTPWNVRPSLGWGFVVQELLVHTEFSSGLPDGVYSYNYRQEWNATELLEAFSLNPVNQEFCLSHLFISYYFEFGNGVIGLAYMGNTGRSGGICSDVSFLKEDPSTHQELHTFRRTSWTTSKSHSGVYLLCAQHQLVTTHELAHNWGSPHDPSGPCSPSDSEGGKYIMYPISSSGLHPNNYRFSNCTIDFISTTLEANSKLCFIEITEKRNVCGNGIVEENENCDAGAMGLNDEDPCCSNTCTFKEDAICSDFNSGCCRNCRTAPSGFICDTDSGVQCVHSSTCDGTSLLCPPLMPVVDGTPCDDEGTCRDGVCVSCCEELGRALKLKYRQCMCEQNATAACMRCCMEVFANRTNGPCLPTNHSLGFKRQCYNGVCNENGTCIPTEGNFVVKLFDFFNKIGFDYVAEFMRTNAVLVILILSALIWIPASLCISFMVTPAEPSEKHLTFVDLEWDGEQRIDDDDDAGTSVDPKPGSSVDA